MGEEEVDVAGRGQPSAVAAAHRRRVLGAQPGDHALHRDLNHLDLRPRNSQLEVLEVLQADPLGGNSIENILA